MKRIIFTLAILVSSTIGISAQGFVIGAGSRQGGAVLMVNERGVYVNGGLRARYPMYRMRPARVAMVRPGYTVGTVARVVVPSRRYSIAAGRGYDRYAMARERCSNRGGYSRYNDRYSRYNDGRDSYHGGYSNDNDEAYGDNDDCEYDENDNARYNDNTQYGNGNDDCIDFQR